MVNSVFMENTIMDLSSESQFTFSNQFQIDENANAEFYGLLLRGMTHKLNNLLAVIQGFSSLIMMDDSVDEAVIENIGHMKEAANNASKLSEKILPAGGCSQITTQELVISELIAMIEDNLREPFAQLNVPFEINCPQKTTKVSADPSRLKTIILELLKNAADAASSGGGQASIRVFNPGEFTKTEDNCVDILVQNTGSEIAADKISKIWEPFYSSKESAHFGIGLTTSAVLAKQMNMRLGVKSDVDSTIFWISIPAC